MNEEKSSIEILKEFARRTHRRVEYSEKSYPDVYPVTFHRRTLYVPDNEFESSYYVCFHDSKEMGEYNLFSGVFTSIDVPLSTEAKVRKKDILDKLNPKIKKHSYKTGSNFDSKAVIMGNDADRIKRIFSKSSIQKIALKVFEPEEVFFIGINVLDVDFVPGLKGKSHFGIFTTRKWILDKEMIEKLFLLIESFKRQF